MTVQFYDKKKYKTFTVGGVASVVSDLAKPHPHGGRRPRAWILTDALGRAVEFRQDRYEVRKIGG